MAEAKKFDDFEIGIPTDAKSIDEKSKKKISKASKIHTITEKEKKVSKWEKVVYVFSVCVIIGIAVLTVKLRTQISEVTLEIGNIQAETTTLQDENKVLNQEVSELSKASRVKEIATKKGLSMIDENIRTIKP